MTEVKLLVNFARFESITDALRKIIDDSAWFCVEKLKKHGFETPKLSNPSENQKIRSKKLENNSKQLVSMVSIAN